MTLSNRSFNLLKFRDNMGILKQLAHSIFFGKRFYRLLTAVIFLFVLSYGISFLFNVAQLALILLVVVLILDCWILFANRNPVCVQRILPEKLSNGEENTMLWQITNSYPFRVRLQLLDE